MIQDAAPVRSGLPDGYDAHFKIDIAAGPVGNIDLRRLPSGFTATRTGVGLYNVTFPSCFAVRQASVTVDAQSVVAANQLDGYPANINANAGTATLVILTPAGALADPPVGGSIYATFALEAL